MENQNLSNQTSETKASEQKIPTADFAMKKFLDARNKNLKDKKLDLYEATRRAANWTWSTFENKFQTSEESKELEERLDASVQAVRPAPLTEDAIRAALSAETDENKRRALVEQMLDTLREDRRISDDEANSLIALAKSFRPPMREKQFAKMWDEADDKVACAGKIANIAINDKRYTEEESDALLNRLYDRLVETEGEVFARQWMRDHTLPKRPARTAEPKGLPRLMERTRTASPSHLDIRKSPEPQLKVVRNDSLPIEQAEGRARFVKKLHAETGADVRDCRRAHDATNGDYEKARLMVARKPEKKPVEVEKTAKKAKPGNKGDRRQAQATA